MIERAKFGGARCRVCGGTMSRAAYRFVEDHVETVWVSAKNPYMSRAGWGRHVERTKQQHSHVACALQVVPLMVDRDLAGFTGTLAERPVIDRVLDLWRECIAAPTDDGPRYVLADMLQSQGDPRGELLALQLLDRDPARVDLLVARFEDRWLGRQRDVLRAAQFVRGFLAKIELSDTAAMTREQDLTLATVEELIPGAASSQRYATYARALRGLRRVEVWDEDSLEALEATPSRIVHVGCHYARLDVGNGLAELGSRFLRACARHPTLSSLAVHPTALDTIVKSPMFGQLERLTLVGRLRDTLPAWGSLPNRLTVAFATSPQLPSLLEPLPGALELRHTDDGLVARLSGRWARPEIAEALPSSTTALEVVLEVGGSASDGLAQAARTRGIALVRVPAPSRAGIWRHP